MTDLTPNPEYIAAALAWRDRHRSHVDRLIASAKASYAPSSEDVRRPELWKAESWKWLARISDA